MAFSARAVANYFIEKASSEGRTLDPMQLQKLVYFAHGWHLALTGKPLIRERVEAWPYGPVVSDLFQAFKRWGSGAIQEPAPAPAAPSAASRMFLKPSQWPTADYAADLEREMTGFDDIVATKQFLDRIWEVYGGFTAVQLSQMTHQPETPWSVVRRTHPGQRSVEIPDDAIKKFFMGRLDHERNVHA
jgi:uncharacterized phage-associated protein